MLFTLALAAADELPETWPIGLTVEMAPAYVRGDGSILATGVWSTVPDALGVEVALTTHHIDVDDASLVVAEADSTGEEPGVRLRWRTLADGKDRLSIERRGGGRLCTGKSIGGFWEGGAQVLVYHPSSGWAAQHEAPPSLILVDDHPAIGALVSLSPGETLSVHDLRKDGLVYREVVRVQRHTGSLVLHREDGAEQLCFEPAQVASRE